MKHDEITFDSHGTACAARHWTGVGSALESDAGRPVVVMAHGLAGTVDSGLVPFAEALAEAGMDVVAFDYRGFGASQGSPRQRVRVADQVDDYRAAVTAAQREQPPAATLHVQCHAVVGQQVGQGPDTGPVDTHPGARGRRRTVGREVHDDLTAASAHTHHRGAAIGVLGADLEIDVQVDVEVGAARRAGPCDRAHDRSSSTSPPLTATCPRTRHREWPVVPGTSTSTSARSSRRGRPSRAPARTLPTAVASWSHVSIRPTVGVLPMPATTLPQVPQQAVKV